MNTFIDIIIKNIQILSLLITSAGVIFLGIQIWLQRINLKAQLINNLTDEIYKYKDILKILYPKENNQNFDNLTNDDITNIAFLLDFFEKIKHLLDNKAIDIQTVDKMFAYRFFMVVNNKVVQARILFDEKFKDCFYSIFSLHQQWTNYRIANNLNITNEDNSLENKNNEVYNVIYNNYVNSFNKIHKK